MGIQKKYSKTDWNPKKSKSDWNPEKVKLIGIQKEK